MTLPDTKIADATATDDAPRLKNNATAYQKIVMPDGTVTGGRLDRSITSDVIFPKDMSGESLLDVGTMEGFFPFEALRRGAERVVGLDRNEDYVHNANILAQKQNLPAEFRRLDIDTETPTGQFDYVTCLNVLHHLIDPLDVIQKLIAVTRKQLILEVAGLGSHERKKLGINWLSGLLINRLPMIYVRRNSLIGNRQKFFISAPAMLNYLMGHRYVFSDVQISPSPFKGRYIAIAHRRRIKRLILVAGPTASGKSTLMDRLKNGESTEIADKLSMGQPKDWDYRSVDSFAKTTQSDFENVVVEVDFLERLKWSISDDRKLRFMDLIRCADEVQVLTRGVDPAQLLRQFEENEIEGYIRKHGKKPKNRMTVQLHEEFAQPKRVQDYYRHWFDFVDAQQLPHVLVSGTDKSVISDPKSWVASLSD